MPAAGDGSPMNACFGPSSLNDVEARQPDCDGHDIKVTEDPLGLPGAAERQHVHQERRCHAEAHDVHEAVQLLAELRSRVRHAGEPAVQRVQDAGEDDVPPRAVELAPGRQHHRPDPEKQIEEREQARHHHHHAAHVRTRQPRPFTRRTPPAPRPRPAPGRRRRRGRWGGRRGAGTRPPASRNRIIPSAGSCVARSPTRLSVTMRRAMSPAIWRTSSGPCAPRIPTDDCSFSRLAFSDAACRNRPAL